VTTLDWIIVALTLLTAGAGYFQGFVVGIATLAGFAVGLVLGGRVGAALVQGGSSSPYAPLFGLIGALLGGLLLGSLFEALGLGLRRRLRAPGLGVVDGLAGAALSAAVALGLVWLAGAVALQTPGARALRADIQRSAVLRALNGVLPPSGPILNALARFDPVPRLAGPVADVPAPRTGLLRDRQVRAAASGIVRVRGTACGLGVEGSGWVAAPGLVVTNAHVVAGQDDTSVEPAGGGDALSAQAVAFDPRNDVAILRVAAGAGRTLALAPEAEEGTGGAILGFPEDGPFDARPARLGATRTVVTQDAYGRGPVSRALVTLRGLVRAGNSGGPVVDARGRVLTTVFARTARGRAGGYGVPNAIVRAALLAAAAGAPVGTGPCVG
jgi:S1-C subfamily serine protease